MQKFVLIYFMNKKKYNRYKTDKERYQLILVLAEKKLS